MKEVKYKGQPIQVCDCDCHVQEWIVKHIVPCCSLCYKPYITQDRKLDHDALLKALEEHYQWLAKNGRLQEASEVPC